MAEYEDDFDDYKDDFEDAPAPAPAPKPAPVAAPPRATVNKARGAVAAPITAASLTGRIRVGGNVPVVPRPSVRTKAAGSGTRTQVARLLDADSYVELFASAPATKFEQLQEKVRLGAWRHAAAQAPDETRGIGTQAEQLSHATVGVQAPDDLGMATKTAAGAAAAAVAAANGLSFDARALDFMRAAGRTVEALCEANLAAAARRARQAQAAQARPGAALGTPRGRVVAVPLAPAGALAPLLQGRAVQAVALSPSTPHTRVLVMGPQPPEVASAAGVSSAWATATLLVVFERQVHPSAVLVTYADVTAVAFSPDATMVIAGTAEGAVSLWDLAEPGWLHPTEFGAGGGSTAGGPGEQPPLVWPAGLRAASYSTHAPERAGGRASGLVSAVRSIQPAAHVAADPGWNDGGAEQALADAPVAPDTAAGPAMSGARDQQLQQYQRGTPRRAIPMFGAGFGSLLLDDGGELAALFAAAPAGGAPATGEAGVDSRGEGGGGLGVGSGRTFQFLALDDRGDVDVWFAVPLGIDSAALARGASLAGLVDQQDFGRSVGSAVKLMRAGGLASVTVRGSSDAPGAAMDLGLVGPQACCLSLCPSDSGRMLVGTEDGRVMQVCATEEGGWGAYVGLLLARGRLGYLRFALCAARLRARARGHPRPRSASLRLLAREQLRRHPPQRCPSPSTPPPRRSSSLDSTTATLRSSRRPTPSPSCRGTPPGFGGGRPFRRLYPTPQSPSSARSFPLSAWRGSPAATLRLSPWTLTGGSGPGIC